MKIYIVIEFWYNNDEDYGYEVSPAYTSIKTASKYFHQVITEQGYEREAFCVGVPQCDGDRFDYHDSFTGKIYSAEIKQLTTRKHSKS